MVLMNTRARRGQRLQPLRVQPLRCAVGASAAQVCAAAVVGLAGLLLVPVAMAQASAQAVAPVAAPSARPASAPATTAVRPASELRVIEDDQVRIEETRLRGQLQRVTVAPKGSPGSTMRPYEINVGAGGRDPSQDKSGAGQRVWSVLRF
jgi:hypothetical protein